MSKKRLGKRVLALRGKGLSFSEVGEKLGLTKQRAHKIHQRCIAEQQAA